MKIALLFPGQGSQVVGMGKNFYENFSEAREIFEQANEVMGYDLKQKIFEGTEDELKQTAVTQPAIFTVSCAAFQVFTCRLPLTAYHCFSAGHSLGEYSALFSAKVFDFQTGLKLVKYRGSFIQECCQKMPGTMVAVMGMEREELNLLCAEIAKKNGVCEMVNFNAPGQIVVAGSKAAMDALNRKVAERSGARAVPLSVSGAFHSSLMKPAAEKMAEVLAEIPLQDARIPVITNVDAETTTDKESLRKKLAMQIDHPVFWEDSVRKMIAQGTNLFIEIGPGKVLSGLLRKIDKTKKALNVEETDSLNRTVEVLNAPA